MGVQVRNSGPQPPKKRALSKRPQPVRGAQKAMIIRRTFWGSMHSASESVSAPESSPGGPSTQDLRSQVPYFGSSVGYFGVWPVVLGCLSFQVGLGVFFCKGFGFPVA